MLFGAGVSGIPAGLLGAAVLQGCRDTAPLILPLLQLPLSVTIYGRGRGFHDSCLRSPPSVRAWGAGPGFSSTPAPCSRSRAGWPWSRALGFGEWHFHSWEILCDGHCREETEGRGTRLVMGTSGCSRRVGQPTKSKAYCCVDWHGHTLQIITGSQIPEVKFLNYRLTTALWKLLESKISDPSSMDNQVHWHLPHSHPAPDLGQPQCPGEVGLSLQCLQHSRRNEARVGFQHRAA